MEDAPPRCNPLPVTRGCLVGIEAGTRSGRALGPDLLSLITRSTSCTVSLRRGSIRPGPTRSRGSTGVRSGPSMSSPRSTLVALFAIIVALAVPAILPDHAIRRALAQVRTSATMPVSEIQPGMRGYGLTVFRGTQPERFEVEVHRRPASVPPRSGPRPHPHHAPDPDRRDHRRRHEREPDLPRGSAHRRIRVRLALRSTPGRGRSPPSRT
jgi:hypothetical protein